jgi:predicted RNA-binding Zn-ribbon protein involved in translation (DUF1610 family)
VYDGRKKKRGTFMECERCDVEMRKESVSFPLGYSKDKTYPNGGTYQEPIMAKSIYTCPNCGKIELNVRE